IPGQTLEIWRETLTEALAMASEHISCYEVIYEEDTALYAQLKAGQFDQDEDLACVMYDELVELAEQAGFQRYEVANFARANRRETEHRKPDTTERSQPAAARVQEPKPEQLFANTNCHPNRQVPCSLGLRPLTLDVPVGFELPFYACRH